MAASGGSWNKGRYTNASGQITLRVGDVVRQTSAYGTRDRFKVTGIRKYGKDTTYYVTDIDARPGSFAAQPGFITGEMTARMGLVEG